MQFDDEKHELGVFEDMFYRDIESWWDTNYFYCEGCLDQFISEWPLAYSADKAKLQRSMITLDLLYSGGRLQDAFSKQSFDRLIQKLECPHCHTPLSGSICPYDLPFDVSKSFHSDVCEVSDLAKRTPFLLLTHPLCKNVFELLKRKSAEAVAQVVSDRLYRARILSSSVSQNLECFDFPPAHVVSEGRYNHAGKPVLYLASAVEVCLAELRNAESLIASFNYIKKLKILDLVEFHSYEENDINLIGALCYSALISAPENGEGWSRPAYVFTRFVADCAAFFGFDAIKYPSTRISNQDGCYNLVVLNSNISLSTAVCDISYQVYPRS